MPQVNVTERTVTPKLDHGAITGLYAGLGVLIWMFLIGAAGSGGAADFPNFIAAGVLGDPVGETTGFGFEWLIGVITELAKWSLVGIVFALLWPRIRRYGTLTPSVLYAISWFVLVQIVVRIANPEVGEAVGFTGVLIGYVIAGFVFAWRYRRA